MELEPPDNTSKLLYGEPDNNSISLTGDVFKALILIGIILLAIFSNLLVILAVILYRRLRGINNYFLVSLAFADLLVACCAMTFNATQEISGRWIFGSLVCDLWNSIDVHVSTVSTLHLCCISLDRYYAIVRPLDYQATITTRVAVIMLVIAWVAPTFISFVPIFLGWYTTKEHLKARTNHPNECTFVVNQPYAFISSALTFWFPVFVMLLTYQRVYREAMKQKRMIERLSAISTRNFSNNTESICESSHGDQYCKDRTVSWRTDKSEGSLSNVSTVSEQDVRNPNILIREKLVKKQIAKADHENGKSLEIKPGGNRNRNHSLGNVLGDVRTRARLSIVTSTHIITEGLRERRRIHAIWRREHKAFVTLGVVIGAFLVCWLPFFTWYLTTTICGSICEIPPHFVSLLFWIGYLNSTLNPVIYAMTNQDFKLAFVSIIRRICCCMSSRRSMQDL